MLKSPVSGLPSGIPIKIFYVCLISLMRATCPVCLILDMITVIIFGEKYKFMDIPVM
jgi:hypothetical protein